MAIEIKWTFEAQKTFATNIEYLAKEWSEKEITRFVQDTENIIIKIQQNPDAYQLGIKDKRYRRVRINKYIVLFYRHLESRNKISLITFWHSKQDPSKLKY